MDTAEIVGASFGAVVITLIFAVIFSALAHFISGDNIWSVMCVYLVVAVIPSLLVNTSISRTSVIMASIITMIIVVLIMNFAFPIVFGPNIGFPYSMLGLGPVITGIIFSVIIAVLAAVLRV